MRYCCNLLSFGLVTVGTVMLLTTSKKVSAIGCDTYYRVTGQIAGCTDVSTEKAQELWLEKYSVCLEQQLIREISVYRSQLRTYYAQWNSEDSNRYLEFNDISFSDLDTSPSLFTTTYKGAEFCPHSRINDR